MSLRDPMPQAEEPDEDPREPVCDECFARGPCHCYLEAAPDFADEDDPAPMSGRWVEDIDF